jgi:hypothetical protein
MKRYYWGYDHALFSENNLSFDPGTHVPKEKMAKPGGFTQQG